MACGNLRHIFDMGVSDTYGAMSCVINSTLLSFAIMIRYLLPATKVGKSNKSLSVDKRDIVVFQFFILNGRVEEWCVPAEGQEVCRKKKYYLLRRVSSTYLPK